jgi:hypothetical protein
MTLVPAEVLDIIFSDLVPREGGYYDLWQASLICRAWRHPAQRWAFRAIRVMRLGEWLQLVALVSENTVIGSYIVDMSIEFDLGDREEADKRVGTLFPNVTHLQFFSSERQTSLELASRFLRLASLITSKRLLTCKNMYGDDMASMALASIACPPSGLPRLLDWLDHAGTAQRDSLSKFEVIHERSLLYNNHNATLDLCGALARLFRSYHNLEVLDLYVHQDWSEASSGQSSFLSFRVCVLLMSCNNQAFGMGESYITHLHLRGPEDACPAIFGILRNTSFPHLTHIHVQLMQTPFKCNRHDFDPTDIEQYGVPRKLAQRLESVVVEADGWRDKDRIWYEQLRLLFGSANREGVLVLNLAEQYFPAPIEVDSDSASYEIDEESELSDPSGLWMPRQPNTERTMIMTEEVLYISSSTSSIPDDVDDDVDDDEDEDDNEGSCEDSHSRSIGESAAGEGLHFEDRREVDRYIFRDVPDIAFHEGSDGDLDDSDLEVYRARLM